MSTPYRIDINGSLWRVSRRGGLRFVGHVTRVQRIARAIGFVVYYTGDYFTHTGEQHLTLRPQELTDDREGTM